MLLKLISITNLTIFFWRGFQMAKNTMGIVKGVGAGLAAGAVVGFIGSQMMKNDKQMKKKAGKAMHAVGDLLDNVQYMFKS